MDIDPFSMLEVSLQEGPDVDGPNRPIPYNSSSTVMHQVENDVQVFKPPPPLSYIGSDVLNPQRAVLNNIQKLATTSKEEEKFRRRAYSSISLVLRKRLHCTICDAHIGAYLGLKDMDIEHPLLKVLACSKCTLKYHYLEFPLNQDGRDIRCRWCTNSSKEESPLRFCSYCPFAFCEMCIYRNLPLDELASNKNNWVCFICNVKDLWPSRAVLWALRVLIDTNLALKEEKKWSTDQSTCCKNKIVKQRRTLTIPQPIQQPTNGYNVATRSPAVRPLRLAAPNNNYRIPYNRNAANHIIRPIQMQPTSYRSERPVNIQRKRIVSTVPPNANTQLYDTSWLTEKVSNITSTIVNLNNNLHRLAQGIPEKENKYSIKSKMISMVSLLNISATQLQKASKEMEEESKQILDKNYRFSKVLTANDRRATATVVSSSVAPYKTKTNPTPRPASIQPLRNRSRSSSSKKNKRRRMSEESEEEDTEFAVPDSDEEDLHEKYKLRTRQVFVSLERVDSKYIDEFNKSESEDEEPQPSTSTAPDPLGTVSPEELRRQEKDNNEVSATTISDDDKPDESMTFTATDTNGTDPSGDSGVELHNGDDTVIEKSSLPKEDSKTCSDGENDTHTVEKIVSNANCPDVTATTENTIEDSPPACKAPVDDLETLSMCNTKTDETEINV